MTPEQRIDKLEKTVSYLLEMIAPCTNKPHVLGAWKHDVYIGDNQYTAKPHGTRQCMRCSYKETCDHATTTVQLGDGAMPLLNGTRDYEKLCTRCGQKIFTVAPNHF